MAKLFTCKMLRTKPSRTVRSHGGRRRLALPGLLSILLLGSLGEARAQLEPEDPDFATEGMRRAGRVFFQPYVTLRDVGYDDNVTFSARNPVADTTATLAPGVSALIRTGHRGGLLVGQEFGYVAFGSNPQWNYWDSHSRVKGVFKAKHVSLSLEDRYDYARRRPSLEVDARVREKRNVLVASIATRGTGRVGGTFLIGHERLRYPVENEALEYIGERLNRDGRSVAAIGTVQVLPKTTLLLEGNIERLAYAEPGQDRDSRMSQVLAGLRFDPSAFLQGTFQVGAATFKPLDRKEGEYRGVVGNGQLSLRVGSRGRIQGSLGRDLIPSTTLENLYFISTSWSAGYETFFSRSVSAMFSYGRRLHHYPQEMLLSQSPVSFGTRDDRIRTSRAEIRYHANPQMQFTAGINRVELRSTQDFTDMSRTLYVVGTTYAF
jgi:Putative beta-barrel porin 2